MSRQITKIVYVGGGRHHTDPKIIAAITDIIFGRKAHMSVGCACGADQMFIESAIARQRIRSTIINAVFGKGGYGKAENSATNIVQKAAQFGAAVHYLAGGLPAEKPLNQRLMARSIKGLVGASCAIFVSPGPGSYKVMAQAVIRNIPLWCFTSTKPKQLTVPGTWVQANLYNLPGWQFQTAKIYTRA